MLSLDREARISPASAVSSTYGAAGLGSVTLQSGSGAASNVKATSDEEVFDPTQAGVITADPGNASVDDVINLPYQIKDDSGNPIANGAAARLLRRRRSGDRRAR